MSRRKHGKLRAPDLRTAHLLGLNAVETRLPAASQVRLTKHAVERFQQRCEPGLSIGAARGKLDRLKRGARVLPQRPEWIGEEQMNGNALGVLGWIVVELPGKRCVMPVRVDEQGAPFAATCLV